MDKRVCILIDDDPDENEFFQMALDDIGENFQLIYINNGELAVRKLQEQDLVPDYIFLDINMPKLNDWECLKIIRTIERLKNVSIAIYSTTLPNTISSEEKLSIETMLKKQESISGLVRVLRSFFEL